MKHLYIILLLSLLTTLTSCEKNIAEEGQDSVLTAGLTEGDRKNALTVAQAQQVAAGTQICVKGYIVASTQKSMNNTDFFSPFEGSTAIVLADKSSDNDLYDDDLLPICLTDAGKGIRDAYNLEAHPEYHDKFVYILGTREQYLSTAGLKKVKGIEVDPNHVVTPDESGDNTNGDEGDNPGTPDTPDNPNTPDNPGTPDTPDTPDNPSTPTSNVLTVAQVKTEAKNLAHVTVKGYIVAATGYDIKKYTHFAAPFEENGYIVLADQPFDNTKTPEDQYDTQTFKDLLPVNLGTKGKKLQTELNLVTHPQLQNKCIQISGVKTWFLGTYGIDKVESYQWITP